MVKVRLVKTDPLQRICDLLVLTLPGDVALAEALGLGAAAVLAPGKHRIAPAGASRARQVLIVAGDGADPIATGEAAERAIRAASIVDHVTLICWPAPNSVEPSRAGAALHAQLEGIDRALAGGALPLLRLIELTVAGEERLAELRPILDGFVFTPRKSARGEGEIRVRGADERVEAGIDALNAAKRLIDSGNLIAGYAEARQAADAGIAPRELNYLEVLALARLGNDQAAIAQYEHYRLGEAGNVDHLALWARLLKDSALDGPVDQRQQRLHAAARAYGKVHEKAGGAFALINVATLSAAAGRREEAIDRAEAVLADPAVRIGADYWSAATRTEALLVLGRDAEAEGAAREAMALPGATLGARSSTVRQLERLLPLVRPNAEAGEPVLAVLRPPPVLHFCGHIFQADPAAEARLAADIDAALDRLGAAIGYGALAAGADILIAERIIAREGELHVVLPFRQADFVSTSVAPAGDWIARFEQCLAKAASVRMASEMPYVGDHRQFSHAAKVAMGLASLRANHLSTRPEQLAVWDGADRGMPAGTAVDIGCWRETGRATHIVPAGDIVRVKADQRRVVTVPTETPVGRAAHALLFADFAGFSKIPEDRLPGFWTEVMARAAIVINRHDAAVLSRGTWGDAIHLVIEGAQTAAELALDLQDALGAADFDALDCGPAGMRMALHYGPIYRTRDPITGRDIFFGTEVSRTARLEPITPTGSVYVTEPFAALIALTGGPAFRLHSAGNLQLAKNYGVEPVYLLAKKSAAMPRA